MTASLTIYNDDNVIQIDENYICLSLVGKGTVAANTPDSNFNRLYYVDVVYNGTSTSTPTIAIRSNNNSNGWFGIGGVQRNGNQFVFRIIGVNGGPNTSSSWDNTVYFYIFDRPPTTNNGSNFGLQLFRDDGTCCFDSNTPIMKLVAQSRANNSSKLYAGISLCYLTVQDDSIEISNPDGSISYQPIWTGYIDNVITSSAGGPQTGGSIVCGGGQSGSPPRSAFPGAGGADIDISFVDVTNL